MTFKYLSAKFSIVENCVTRHVVEKIYENFTPGYFQMVMIDLIELVQKSIGRGLAERKFTISSGYIVGLNDDLLRVFLSFYSQGKNNFNSSLKVSQKSFPINDEIKKFLEDEFVVKTIDNFIDYEKRKYNILSKENVLWENE